MVLFVIDVYEHHFSIFCFLYVLGWVSGWFDYPATGTKLKLFRKMLKVQLALKSTRWRES